MWLGKRRRVIDDQYIVTGKKVRFVTPDQTDQTGAGARADEKVKAFQLNLDMVLMLHAG